MNRNLISILGILILSVSEAIAADTDVSLPGNEGILLTTDEEFPTVNVTLPANAQIQLGTKSAHFVDFTVIEPYSVTENGDYKVVTYHVQPSVKLNYRTWGNGMLTQAGYFTAPKDAETPVNLQFDMADYEAFDPKRVNHDPNSNEGYESGDIFVNINERNHLVMKVGDTFDAHAMRTWQLTDTQINNYFFEPDFHYTVIGLDGKPSTGVIEVSTDDTTSAWRTIKAVGEGTAIVLVTYDAISVKFNGEPIMGGQYWGAIWPENTAAYVVTVGETAEGIIPNMKVNEKYNAGEDGKALLKLAGENVDAEHDVFYYLDSEEGYDFTFTPEGVASVTLAYPIIGENSASYNGFGSDGVTANADGSYTLRLKYGRNIVKLTDASGRSVYQVLNARPCHREIINESREGYDKIYPGDKVKIQYSGLFHPANKLAGIYNMSAYVAYNGTPNGSSLTGGANQYTFGSAPKAQAVEVEIPDNFTGTEYVMTEGVIQVNGYGDPIGNHRSIDKTEGRQPNFNAVAHKTYFGAIPQVSLPVVMPDIFTVTISCNVDNPQIEIKLRDQVIAPNADGTYTCTNNTYSIMVRADKYHVYTGEFSLTDDMDLDVTIPVELESCPDAWDGKTKSEPVLENGVYRIGTGAELAWLADKVKTNGNMDALLTADIELNLWPWSPITKYSGHFNGNGHRIDNIYIPNGSAYSGLFGYVEGTVDDHARIEGVTITGKVYSNMGAGGIAGNIKNTDIDRCVNLAYVEGTSGFCLSGGITALSSTNTSITNCVNGGTIVSTKKGAGIAAQPNTSSCFISNCLNYGPYPSTSTSAPCAGGVSKSERLTNLFALETASAADGTFAKDGSEFTSAERMASGEVAWRLGAAFGQTIGADAYPVLGGAAVFKVTYALGGEAALFTNGALPGTMDGQEAHWFADAGMTQPVTSVEADATLYLKLGSLGAIDAVGADADAEVRWYNIRGIGIPAPEAGEHGIFIRVVNGHGEKVVL